jgi:hypothetical protein
MWTLALYRQSLKHLAFAAMCVLLAVSPSAAQQDEIVRVETEFGFEVCTVFGAATVVRVLLDLAGAPAWVRAAN